jgi:hypothetical protein
MRITADDIEALAGMYLSPHYDNPAPTPQFHRECWQLYCSDTPAVAVAAPRSHAKSTALTHDFVLANVLYRVERYVLLLSSSEEMAMGHLVDIAEELRENDDIIRDFHVKAFTQDSKSDIIVECHDGHDFRILARGAEQKIRGLKWKGMRPGLLVVDDLEDDELVENKDRRKKLERWFLRAARPALRLGGRVRFHGTVLHKDSLLAKLLRDNRWISRRYAAHAGFTDFSNILWPEQFTEAVLRDIRQGFINRLDSAGYSQEYLNDPRDDENSYLRIEQFRPLKPEQMDDFRVLSVGCDFAVSKLDAANRTAFVVAGKTPDNFLDYLDYRAGRWDSAEWIEEMFTIHNRWNPEYWFIEDGVIWKTLWPTVREEMRRRDTYLNFVPVPSLKDKPVRGRSFQNRMKAGACRFNMDHSMYIEYREEMLDFSETAEARLDDFFDATSIISRGFEDVAVHQEDEKTDDELDFEWESARLRAKDNNGRSSVTGY